MKDELLKKNKSLKKAIEKYNMYKRFVDLYNRNKSLDEYINHIRLSNANAGDDVIMHYENMIRSHDNGNDEPLLTNLYNKLLAADDDKNKLSNELKTVLNLL